MVIDFSLFPKGKVIGVALSGGSDSMALIHLLSANSVKFGFGVVAINVEHGIRGQSSIDDSEFVKSYCEKSNIKFFSYSVDCKKKAKDEKLSLEESARILRYQCFFDAISTKKCDLIATAHHLKDNAESVLFNLFRGTGLKGLCGITEYEDKIIRPFLSVKKEEIDDYVKENDIPFVTDETNLSDDYTRNYLRHNVIPRILEVFPEAEKSILRLSEIARTENEYLEKKADELLTLSENSAIIKNGERAIFNRAVIRALKHLGIEKDWEKVHIDYLYFLSKNQNGKCVSLPKNIKAYSEYGKTIIAKSEEITDFSIPFKIGDYSFNGFNFKIEETSDLCLDLKSGLYLDKDKLPIDTVIRLKKDGDLFTKFGGKTKKLNDYLTDIKMPLRERATLPVIASKNIIFAVIGTAVSDTTKVDNKTKKIIKITKE